MKGPRPPRNTPYQVMIHRVARYALQCLQRRDIKSLYVNNSIDFINRKLNVAPVELNDIEKRDVESFIRACRAMLCIHGVSDPAYTFKRISDEEAYMSDEEAYMRQHGWAYFRLIRR